MHGEGGAYADATLLTEEDRPEDEEARPGAPLALVGPGPLASSLSMSEVAIVLVSEVKMGPGL